MGVGDDLRVKFCEKSCLWLRLGLCGLVFVGLEGGLGRLVVRGGVVGRAGVYGCGGYLGVWVVCVAGPLRTGI